MKRLIATASLALALYVAATGFVSAQAAAPYIGEVRLFAFNYCPNGWLPAAGQVLPTNTYPNLFTLLKTTYGGDGQTNFALPNLLGRAPYGSGSPPAQVIGTVYGPAIGGGNQGAGLALNWCVAVRGYTPPPPGSGHPALGDPYLSELRLFAFDWCPDGWAPAAGQLVSLTTTPPNWTMEMVTALYSLLNANFGGDGQTNFALPNLVGSAPYGDGAGYAPGPEIAAVYGPTIGSNNQGTALAMNWCVAILGIYPPRE